MVYEFNKEKTIQLLKEQGYNDPEQEIDWGSYSNDISINEFLLNEYNIVLKGLKEEVENIKAIQEKQKLEDNKRIKEEETRLITEWKSQKPEHIDIKEFEIMKDLILTTAKGFSNATIITGEGGISKTYTCLNVIKEVTQDYQYFGGYTTPLSLYKNLYKWKDKLIILDDTEGIFSDEKAISILKNVLWDSNGKRIVFYSSTSDKAQDVPECFEFTGRVIILCNKIPKENDISIKAMLSRAINYELKFTYKEKINLINKILEKKEDLTKEQKEQARQIIKDNTSLITLNFNIRTLEKLIGYIKYNKEKADILFKATIEEDKEEKIILELMDSNLSNPEQIIKFSEFTGKSRASFYRIKKRLKEKM